MSGTMLLSPRLHLLLAMIVTAIKIATASTVAVETKTPIIARVFPSILGPDVVSVEEMSRVGVGGVVRVVREGERWMAEGVR